MKNEPPASAQICAQICGGILNPANKGILYGVSVGPGDPELITVKALKTIAACNYISFIDPGKSQKAVAFEIARAALPEIEQKEQIRLTIPMTADKDIMHIHQAKAFDTIAGRLNEGANVSFITLGDVSVYSSFGYLRKLALAAGFETRMISGVPSFCAAAAALDIDLALGEQDFHIFCASEAGLDDFLALKGTRIFMKGPSKIPRIIKKIKEKRLDAGLVSNCGMKNELVVKSLQEYDADRDLGYYSLIIVREDEA